jgi:glycosyltransferase involved in cell wall biosynthesis
VKLAVVVQRYGAQISGGAELHARYIVELLAKHHAVDVLTTCASDYVTWRNEFAPGTEMLRGVQIRRFPVSQERNPDLFGRMSVHVFDHPHSIADELTWLDSEGPTSPALIAHLGAHDADYDYVIFFSYRYYLSYHGVRAVPNKAILVPTAERDSALGLAVFGPIFRGVRAFMYNSPEERAMIQAVSRNTDVPGVVVGVGSDVPRHTSPERFRQKYHLHDPFVLYVGRIDENKGCRELFSYFTSYRPRLGQRLTLVLIGNSILPIPKHSNIRHLGYVSDQDKFDALAAAELLAMPSYYESLSMVALEAWALGKPVLANGRCDVLRGQCIRSRAGLFYDTFDEFAETLFTLTTYKPLTESLGENGRRFYEQHYAWPVIERKYLDMLNQLAAEEATGRKPIAIEPLPGWLARRRKTLPAAAEIVKGLPHEVPREGNDAAPAPAARAAAKNGAPRADATPQHSEPTAMAAIPTSAPSAKRDASRPADATRHLRRRPRPDGRRPAPRGASQGSPKSSATGPSAGGDGDRPQHHRRRPRGGRSGPRGPRDKG